MMRICVFGAGALGSAIGGLLASKNDVFLIGRKAHVQAIQRKGLVITGDVRRRVKVRAFTRVEGLEPPDILLISTKAYDTNGAIADCDEWVGNRTAVLTLQNGLGNLETLKGWRRGLAFGGTTTLGSTMIAPGRVRISGMGRTTIGSNVNRERAKDLVRLFVESGIPTRLVEDIDAEIWAKAIVSSCINPLTAVLRVQNGVLLESEVVTRMIREVSIECERVALASGVKVKRGRAFPRVRLVAADTSKNLSSMLQDVLKGKRTEIEFLNGAFWKLSQAYSLEAPLNATLTAMVASLKTAHSRNLNIGT